MRKLVENMYSVSHLKCILKKFLQKYKIYSKFTFKIKLKVKVNIGNAYPTEFYRLKHVDVDVWRLFSVSPE